MYDYELTLPTAAKQILEKAAEILADTYLRGDTYSTPDKVKEYLRFKLGGLERETFSVMLLDNQNRLIDYVELFYGTINAASIYPREVVKLVLKENAAAVILAHNHPSGIAEPSQADKHITERLKQALALVDIRILDHIIIGENSVSFAERGLL
ncbi:DNA repair protein RadC [Vibrio parahaemolyticus]|nr:DNA repair protein RadC [Vibrio parahaemolyticus]